MKLFFSTIIPFGLWATVCHGQISVSIQVGKDSSSSNVLASGYLKHIITDSEAKSFKLGPENVLRNDWEAYYGKAPNDAYLHTSSGNWGNLYELYNWPQVETTLTVVSAEILGIESKPTILATKILENDSDFNATFTADISSDVQQTITSTWSQTNSFTQGQEINYGVQFDGIGVGGKTTMSYTEEAMEGGSKSKSTTVGSSSGVSVNLQPHQKVEAILSASQGTMTVKINYRVSLSGCSAVNYGADGYRGHHFYCAPVGNIMETIGVSNDISTSETIQLNYFANGSVQLKNLSTGESQDITTSLGEFADSEQSSRRLRRRVW